MSGKYGNTNSKPQNYSHSGKENTTSRFPNNSFQHSTTNQIICQFCNQPRHTAKQCFKAKQILFGKPSANFVAQAPMSNQNLLVDSATSHHMTSNINNLSIGREYEGTNEIIIGDGTGLLITHISSTSISFNSISFSLSDTLSVPSI